MKSLLMKRLYLLKLTVFLIASLGLSAKAVDKAGPVPRAIGPSDIGIDPTLPNVLIIGDSISLHYTPFVVAELAGRANVFHSGGKWGWGQVCRSEGRCLAPREGLPGRGPELVRVLGGSRPSVTEVLRAGPIAAE